MATHYDKFVAPRLVALFDAANDIFDLEKISWNEFRRNISPAQVKDFYRFVYNLWPENISLDDYLPPPDATKLRAVYIGQESPRTIQRKIARYTLYNDEVIVTLPFLNPRIMHEEYNPIFHPEAFLENTLQSLAFLYNITPWMKSGQVLPILSPIDYDGHIRHYVFDLARQTEREGLSDKVLNENEPWFRENNGDDLVGFYLRIPAKHRFGYLKQSFPEKSDDEIRELERVMKHMRENDPYILDQDASTSGELHMFRVGATAEIGELICHATGSYMYTDIPLQWNKILALKASDDSNDEWSTLTHAFQQLDFRFLDQVDPKFASSIALEGRLASFRSFLRDIWRSSTKEKEPSRIAQASLEFSDRLTYEYQLAKADWSKIDIELLKWVGTQASAAGATIQGGMSPIIPLGGLAASSVVQLLRSRIKRKNFKRTVPMAVLLELNKYKELGRKS